MIKTKDKKIIYLSVFLILAVFLVSACTQTKGINVNGAEARTIKNTYYFELVDNELGLDGYTREAYGKDITLIDVGSAGAVIVDVDGVQDMINSGATKTINGISIKNKWTFYTDNKFRRAAELFY